MKKGDIFISWMTETAFYLGVATEDADTNGIFTAAVFYVSAEDGELINIHLCAYNNINRCTVLARPYRFSKPTEALNAQANPSQPDVSK